MGRYAIFKPGQDTARPAHWSDGLKPGALWFDLNMQISIDPEQWARECGIPPERAAEEFSKFVEEIKDEAIGRAVRARVTLSPELRGPLV